MIKLLLLAIFGCMNYSDSWTADGGSDGKFGMYSFQEDGTGGFTAAGNISTYECDAQNGGAYGRGKYICYEVTGSYLNYYVTFRTLDPENGWKQTSSVSLPKNYKYVPCDLTYNYITDSFIAVCQETYENSSTGWLCEVNPETGEMTEMGHLSTGIKNIAADSKGQLWGIGNNGALYMIAADGSLTMKLQTDWKPTSQEQGATIDLLTDKYIWAANAYKISEGSQDETYTQLVEIDLSSLEISTSWEFPTREQLTGLCIIDAHPDAPAGIEDLVFKAKTLGGLDGIVSFTLPTKTYTGKALSGSMEVKLWIDGELVDTKTMTAGCLYSFEQTFASEGVHSAKVVLSRDGKDGVIQKRDFFFGLDTPMKVANATLTTNDDRNVAFLKWDAVTEGVYGGYIQPENIKYAVIRQPEGVNVGVDMQETSLTDTIKTGMAYVHYDIYAYVGDKESKVSRSNYERIGAGNSLPYGNDFGSKTAFMQFFTIDNNGDGTDSFESSAWNWDDDYGAAFYYGFTDVTADDYLISPKLTLEAGKTYHLHFQIYGYQGWENKLTILAGNQPTVRGMNRIVKSLTSYTTMSTPEYKDIYFTAQEGERYLGIHNISTAGDHMSIDNFLVQISDSGETPEPTPEPVVEAPTAPTNVNAAYVGKDNIEITWDASESGERYGEVETPAYNVYRDGVVVAEGLKDCSFTDTPDNTQTLTYAIYSVSAKNSGGESDQTKADKIMVGKPYSLPFSETWANQTQETNPWFRESTSNCCWSCVATGYDPYTLGQDGAGMMSCDLDETSTSAGYAMLQTPNIDFTTSSIPHLSFYYYTGPDYGSITNLQICYRIEGEELVTLSKQYMCQNSSKEWKHVEVDIPGLGGAARASIFFCGSVLGASNTIHLDNVEVSVGVPAEGIDEVLDKGTKVDGPDFNLAGQRIDYNYKGIVINGNRKVLRRK